MEARATLTDAAWQSVIATIEQNDEHTRGIVILGLGESEEKLAQSFSIAASYPLVKGFAVGRTIFADVAEQWFLGEKTDAQAIDQMAKNYKKLCNIWDKARNT